MLQVGTKFSSFDELRHTILVAFPEEGIRCKPKQYRKSGDRQGQACRWIFVCKCAGSPASHKNVRKSMKTGCKWSISAWWPTSLSGPLITSTNLVHSGHDNKKLPNAVNHEMLYSKYTESSIKAYFNSLIRSGVKFSEAIVNVKCNLFQNQELSKASVRHLRHVYSKMKDISEKNIDSGAFTVINTDSSYFPSFSSEDRNHISVPSNGTEFCCPEMNDKGRNRDTSAIGSLKDTITENTVDINQHIFDHHNNIFDSNPNSITFNDHLNCSSFPSLFENLIDSGEDSNGSTISSNMSSHYKLQNIHCDNSEYNNHLNNHMSENASVNTCTDGGSTFDPDGIGSLDFSALGRYSDFCMI